MASIPLRGKDGSIRAYAIVDDEDAPALMKYRWSLTSNGYARRGFWSQGKKHFVYMHRAILGICDPKVYGDHRDRDRLNNRRSNLREVTSAENHQNLGAGDKGASMYRGVGWMRSVGKWRAQHQIHGETVHLGLFTSEEEAARVASEWRREHMPYSVEQNAQHDR